MYRMILNSLLFSISLEMSPLFLSLSVSFSVTLSLYRSLNLYFSLIFFYFLSYDYYSSIANIMSYYALARVDASVYTVLLQVRSLSVHLHYVYLFLCNSCFADPLLLYYYITVLWQLFIPFLLQACSSQFSSSLIRIIFLFHSLISSQRLLLLWYCWVEISHQQSGELCYC